MLPINAASSIPYQFSSGLPSFSGITGNRVTKLFYNPILIQPSSPFTEGEVVSLANFWKGPFEIFMIGLWGLLWADTLNNVVIGGKQAYEQFNTAQEHRWTSVKELCLKGVSFGGITANIATWANDIKAIALGAAASAVKMLGFGASCITSSARAYYSFQEIFDQAEQIRQASNGVECTRLKQKQLLSSLDLAAHGTGAIWAFLGFWGLGLGVALPAALMTALVTISCILAVSAIFYRIHLSHIHPKAAPRTA